jgi:shikimate dehydrogenase
MKQLGLIGFPLTHSFSKKYFEEKFEKLALTGYSYELFPLSTIDELPVLINKIPGLVGLNVTLPYKEQVIPFLTRLDETAAAVGAVNTIAITKRPGKTELVGYNTDIFGFRQSIKPFLEPQHERALIFGTGGASKAVEHVLKQIGVTCFFVSRDKSKFIGSNCFAYEELNEFIISSFKLIVNTSPVGMYPASDYCPQMPYSAVSAGHLLYDLVYNPEETLFLKKGKEQGAVTVNGLSMLYHQADKAWEIWTKIP